MQKIISLFQRNYEGNRLVRDEVVEGSEWVLAGEGEATRKYDGACCAIINGSFYKRYDAKQGKQPPSGFIPAQEPDEKTGHWPGWLAVGAGPEDQWFRLAYANSTFAGEGLEPKLPNGTYEACGPHFQGNPEGFLVDGIQPHGWQKLADAPRSFGELYEYFKKHDIEGIVWHHSDGRMVKIKAKDFGLKRSRRCS